jgi:hypothetical protein
VSTNISVSQWARCLLFRVRKKLLLYSVLFDFRKSIAVWKVPRFRTSVLVRATCRWRWVLTIGRMILTGEKLSTMGKTCSSVIFPHYKSHVNCSGNKPGLPRSKPSQSYGAAFERLRLTWVLINIQSVPRSKHSVSVIKTSRLMLCREIIAVCSQIHIKHINTLCGQNVELLNVKLVVHIVTSGSKGLNTPAFFHPGWQHSELF